MKSTGMVRRLDDLGRIVIPKEVRKTLRLREGDPMEFFVDNKRLILSKYSDVLSIEYIAWDTVKAIERIFGESVIICDTDKVVAVGQKAYAFKNRSLTTEFSEILRSNNNVTELKSVVAEGTSKCSSYIIPIKSSGDVAGGIILLEKEGIYEPEVLKSAEFASALMENMLRG